MRQNRVTPFSELVAVPARGLVYGNRGCLHDNAGTHPAAVQREALDLVPARVPRLAPGPAPAARQVHRALLPRRGDSVRGRPPAVRALPPCRLQALLGDLADAPSRRVGADTIDARLHAERFDPRTRTQRRHSSASLPELPDGAFVLRDDAAWLVRGDELLRWTPAGYDARATGPRADARPDHTAVARRGAAHRLAVARARAPPVRQLERRATLAASGSTPVPAGRAVCRTDDPRLAARVVVVKVARGRADAARLEAADLRAVRGRSAKRPRAGARVAALARRARRALPLASTVAAARRAARERSTACPTSTTTRRCGCSASSSRPSGAREIATSGEHPYPFTRFARTHFELVERRAHARPLLARGLRRRPLPLLRRRDERPRDLRRLPLPARHGEGLRPRRAERQARARLQLLVQPVVRLRPALGLPARTAGQPARRARPRRRALPAGSASRRGTRSARRASAGRSRSGTPCRRASPRPRARASPRCRPRASAPP